MDQTDWNILNLLSQNKNMTKTAEELYISQPAISYRLQNIEKEFSIEKLFYRDNNGIVFTSEGRHLVNYSQRMLGEYSLIKNTLLNLNDDVTGTVRLGVSNNFALYKLPSAIRIFKTLYPKVYIELITGLSKDIKKLMESGDIHLGIVKGSYKWSDKKYLLQKENQYIISTQNIKMSKLPNYPRIEYNADLLFKRKVDDWWKANYNEKPYYIMKVDKVEICKNMVREGLGYAIIPGICLADNDDLYTHTLLDNNKKNIVRDIWIYTHNKHSYITCVNTLTRFLINYDFDN